MELTDTFTVSTPIDEMWPILCDIERIAPCMPGARLTEVDGDEYRGEVKIKVGPINARFKGTATMVERDDGAHRAVLEASGKDTGGKGNAHATITASASPSEDGGTLVSISTDLSITGKVAQFGRSAMSDISTKLLGQFVTCLEAKVLSGEAESGGGSAPDAPDEPSGAAESPPPAAEPVVDVTDAATATSSGPRRIDAPETEPIDLLDAAGAPVAKRVAAPLAAVMAVFFVIYWWRRRSK